VSESISECLGVPSPPDLMTQQRHRVSLSARECLREGVNEGVTVASIVLRAYPATVPMIPVDKFNRRTRLPAPSAT
jgi:hypothetical protein